MIAVEGVFARGLGRTKWKGYNILGMGRSMENH